MSAFRRTTSGLMNQHLFHNVDLVVFLEGGQTYTKTEVYSGTHNDTSFDILFWKRIFRKFFADKKIKFKSVGSKSTINEIAIDIIEGEISTVVVAMDSEFDEMLQQKVEHPNILYTYGYSWENEIWNEIVIKEVIEQLSAIEIEQQDIATAFSSFLKKIRIGVCADAYLFNKGSSFFRRPSGYMGMIDCSPKDLPTILPERLKGMIESKGLRTNTINAFGRKKSIEVLRHCFGHLLGDYCVQIIIHYLRNRLKMPSIHKDIVYRMGILKYFESHFFNSQQYEYYELQFNRLK
jgi:hypothetical protein